MVHDLKTEGITMDENRSKRIHGPVGLDIGAETSEEIAISIVSEIKAVLSGKKGTSLKFRTDKIHGDTYIIS